MPQSQAQPLPTPPVHVFGEGTREYGQRVLAYLLETGVTARLSDEALEYAWKASTLALMSHDISPAAATNLAVVRRMIHLVQDYRRQLGPKPCDRVQVQEHPTGGNQGGRPAPLVPPTPRLPPQGQARRTTVGTPTITRDSDIPF